MDAVARKLNEKWDIKVRERTARWGRRGQESTYSWQQKRDCARGGTPDWDSGPEVLEARGERAARADGG